MKHLTGVEKFAYAITLIWVLGFMVIGILFYWVE